MLPISRGAKTRVPICCWPYEESEAYFAWPTDSSLARGKKPSQEKFAGLADIDRAYYGGIERGERNVAAINIIKIANASGVEVGKLFPPLSALRRTIKGVRDGR